MGEKIEGVDPLEVQAAVFALRESLRAQTVMMNRLLQAVADEHDVERERMSHAPARRRLELVRMMLAEEADPDRDDGVNVERELGYELRAEHVGVIARGAGAGEALQELARVLDRRLLCVAQDTKEGMEEVWAWFGGQRVFEMGELAQTIRAMAAHHDREVRLATGEPAWGHAGFRLTHRQAQAAMTVAALRRPATVLTRYSDVGLLASALNDEMLGRALVDTYIEPLRDARDGGAALCQTLRAYLAAQCSVSSAAAALGVTRKTVQARLRAAEQRLARSLSACSASLEIALALDQLQANARAPASPPGVAPMTATTTIPVAATTVTPAAAVAVAAFSETPVTSVQNIDFIL
jgi:sugar diacid utilization regulator